MNKIFRYHAITFLFGYLPAVINAAPVIPNSGLIMRESSKMPMMPKKPVDTVIEQPPLKKPMAVQSNLRVPVKNFSFSGNTQFPTSTLQSQLGGYTNRELGFTELQQAAAVITDYYRNAGFLVAYAYLPEQTLENGQVQLAVFEGRLDDQHLKGQGITLLNDTRINKGVLQKFLNTLPEGSMITENNMNDLSLRLNQLPGINAKVVLAPGKETGSSSLAVKVREAPVITGYASTDNYGLYATGFYRFDGGVSINDPFGWGDQLNLRAQTTETGNAVAGWADYNIAINGYGTRLGVNFAELHYNLGRSFTELQADGLARTAGTTLLQPLLLRRNAQLTGFAHYEHRWMQDNINLFNSHNDRELNVMSFSFAGSLTDSWLTEAAVTQAFINVSAGQVDFTDHQAFLLNQSSGLKTSGGYHKFNWLLNRTQTIWGPFSLYANFQGQIASKNLDTSEQISLGGPYNIRAYPVGEGSADEGWQFNAETRYRLPVIPNLPGYLQLIGFIDTGYARVNAQPLPGDTHNSQHLTGYGFGINWMEAAGFSLRTSLAWRDSSSQPAADPNATGPMGYFQLSRAF
ncbi:MAG: POTRA domain-containing protein [Methylococcales bacterium]|nr:POTRA domain-containing protein [Methylococcales bacterium]